MLKRAIACVSLWMLLSATTAEPSLSQHAKELLAIGQEPGISQLDIDHKVHAYLSNLPPQRAVEVSEEILTISRQSGILDRTGFCREMSIVHAMYAPKALLAIEYWDYLTLQSSRVDRKEITEEEFKYLSSKKRREVSDAIERREAIEDAQERRAVLASSAREAAARDQASQEAYATGEMIKSLGKVFRRPAPVTCTSITLGTSVTTQCK